MNSRLNEEQPSGESANSVNGAQKEALKKIKLKFFFHSSKLLIITMSLEITKSNKPRIVNEMPIAGPFTSAIKGFVKLINASI